MGVLTMLLEILYLREASFAVVSGWQGTPSIFYDPLFSDVAYRL